MDTSLGPSGRVVDQIPIDLCAFGNEDREYDPVTDPYQQHSLAVTMPLLVAHIQQ